jgi:Flp pilus assembly protein TadG
MRYPCGRASKQPDSGQAMVEFVLIATAFFLLTFGIIEMGLAVYTYNTISEASREAVRYAAVHSPTSANPATNAQIQQIAINAANGVNLTSSNVAVSWPADQNLPTMDDAEVQITYSYGISIPFMSATTVQLTSTSRMLVSQ